MLRGSLGRVVRKAVSNFRFIQEWLMHGTDPPGNLCAFTNLKESRFNVNRNRLKSCILDNPPAWVVRERESCGLAEDVHDKPVYCMCMGIDDGSFMIACDVCEDWFHGRCVGVKEEQGEEIDLYTCPWCRAG
ncbi:hypothetical protein DPMN_069766 [Dreissena polymorpha]|uniref:Zinc finger PHD-type domain-containing protein n=1 Tax=Dreissena polymorpha TaxID=45954 RepID=A0A9D3Z3W2_DREPO|nr:hypothetical protein DPMN_069766 [Dreissena polymorpha]